MKKKHLIGGFFFYTPNGKYLASGEFKNGILNGTIMT